MFAFSDTPCISSTIVHLIPYWIFGKETQENTMFWNQVAAEYFTKVISELISQLKSSLINPLYPICSAIQHCQSHYSVYSDRISELFNWLYEEIQTQFLHTHTFNSCGIHSYRLLYAMLNPNTIKMKDKKGNVSLCLHSRNDWLI